ncbi:LysM peptidoglycan-binding domain-containing protein [Pediococcus siamensis]|uniref:aggregation-promoting factor n=1 Tax=Pediococcus siamensis TaxID=381829 RepID=UPI0039A2A0EE
MTLKNNITKFMVAFVAALFAGLTLLVSVSHADEIYTVKSGDTLSGIEFKFNKDTNYTKLAQANKISNVDLIYVGQKLLIKSDGEIKAATKKEVNTVPAASSSNTQNTNTTSQSTQKTTQTTSQSTTTQNTTTQNTSSTATGSEASAKAWIAGKESGGSYSARNGQYVGKYQLSSSYLNGDYSAANQEKVANSYVSSRYGLWSAAKAFWQANGWY